ncbi:uncharacterized protein LOC131289770 isoform X1 [Anopheles ziemanni]|uniref:uncharacterized protein LOC131261265 isoform X1 n=1 Tax=Anopheles coustani TaxID=139045 RepID=UPI00265A5190|nr:uncharacterized protein LOC131261265 isoform X1 [Anopheles coustani]XP_058175063.1 uncharacterized protein LOC131289770 isoform X1 [Anopheles ziemanni]
MTSTGSVAVKQERHDEAEINEMAAKIMEAHKQQSAKAAAAAVQQVPGARPAAVGATVAANGVVVPGQANILNYLTRKPTATTVGPANTIMSTVAAAPSTALTALPLGSGQGVASNGGSGKAYDGGGDSNGSVNGSGEKKANDEESQKGRFGWETFPGKVYIPCILRQQERYCAVRMVEMKLLNKYLTVLHQDIYTCTCVRSYYITEAECKLLNEINTKHCDLHYGREMFTLKDLVVRVSDAYKFHQFLDVCYKKLTVGCGPTSDKCGFIRINKESVVPYTVRDGQKMVPLFYFEGETDNLKLKADNLSGWDLSYLKFCCKVQGIRNELFASDSVAVISLTDIKGYFPPGTEFEDYWPSKVVDSQLLCGPKTNNTVHWTRQPVQPPPKAPTILNNTAAVPRKVATNNVYQALQTQQNLAKTNNQMNSITAAVQALTNNWNIVNSNHTNLLSAQQEQLLRLSQAQQAAQAQAQIRNMQSMHSMQQYNTYLNNMSLTSRASQNQPVPPPLVRSAQAQAAHLSNGSGPSSSARSANSSGSNPLPHLSPALSIFATSSSPNGTVNKSRLNSQQISELALSGHLGSSGSAKGTTTTRPAAGNSAQHGGSSFDGLSLGRNVTITPTTVARPGGAGGPKSTEASVGSFGLSYYSGNGSSNNNGTKQPIAYPKNPISTTTVPVGSPTRASPKGVQARQPPPALIPVGGDSFHPELLTQLQTMLNKDIQIFNEQLLEASRGAERANKHSNNSNSNRPPPSSVSSNLTLPSYLESTTNNNTGSSVSSVIVHDNSRASSRVDFGRNQSVITTANSRHGGGGGLNVLAGPDPGRFRSVLAAAGLSDVIDLSSPPRSNMAGATLNQQQQMAAHQQAAVQQQQQQSQSNKRSASNLSGGGRSNTIISSSSGSNGSGGSSLGVGSNYRNPGAAVLQQLQQQQQQQQQAQHHAAAAAAAVAAAAAAANMADATPRLGNVILIPELNASVTPYNKPYEVVKKPVENKFIYCVNKTPYTRPAELLMSIFDLKDVFFPYSSVDVCRRVLAALDVNLFIGNSLQIQALQEAGRTNIDQKMPLVHLTDVMTFMPQLQYMVRSQIQDTPANKRARIS